MTGVLGVCRHTHKYADAVAACSDSVVPSQASMGDNSPGAGDYLVHTIAVRKMTTPPGATSNTLPPGNHR
ncbi:hypothetical protein ACFPVT_07335 [Corynebacterium choanae]|uniref:hypothetical protein n=1 Tax=Corynebacterium choanae TaxID=1862358 RepID=UPI000F501B02|nr:hypothetical protein [Corynebacterium choanae]